MLGSAVLTSIMTCEVLAYTIGSSSSRNGIANLVGQLNKFRSSTNGSTGNYAAILQDISGFNAHNVELVVGPVLGVESLNDVSEN
jgi:hypothetical protein